MFNNARRFDQPIGDWSTGEVRWMTRMFYQATRFSQDLTTWCVSMISQEPRPFAWGAAFETDHHLHPVWGTCPTP